MPPSPPQPPIGIPLFITNVRAALGAVEGFGLNWRNTRFDHYVQLLEELQHFHFPGPFPWADQVEKRRVFFEAAGQCQQLVDSQAIWGTSQPRLVTDRLQRALKGSTLPPNDFSSSDDARNVLFELATAASLGRSGFSVALPDGDEDLSVTFPGLPPFVVECKRPAHDGSVPKNLKKVRHQLRERRKPGQYGLFVLGVDRLLGLAGGTPNADDEASLLSIIEARLRGLSVEVKAIGESGHARLFPHASIGGLLLTGAVFPADKGVLYTVSLMRLFCTGEETHKTSRRILSAFQPSIIMSP